ncbi:MAG: rRNA pseudouridine synthase [Flavobacteriales bacterium]|nr:rRNA pseudouridine synthase [Flavobacteriales bacterium]
MTEDADGGIRLNKYIANSGMCSRREADVFIQNGVVTVNGKMVDELGYKVQPGDLVKFDGRSIIPEKPVYVLLNKPKDFITTSEDPQGRRTVMTLIEGACKERVFPVGRLDRNTTGLLLFTNDGEMADKLMHPRKRVKKIYLAELDKNLKTEHLQQLREGITLEDGPIKPDVVEYAAGPKPDKKTIGVEIHSGRNRIVRRMFEHFGYKVVKLDRVYFAGLTKKNLPRGRYRMLEPMEINMLKML